MPDGYRELEMDGAELWFDIHDDDFMSFWAHYVCAEDDDCPTMTEWTATTVFNEYMYNWGWFAVNSEWSLEDDEFQSHFYYSD